jgi:hypothetical protein
MYEQDHYSKDSFKRNYTDLLLDEAEKLFNILAKELVDETITDYSFSIPSSLSSEERQKSSLNPNSII